MEAKLKYNSDLFFSYLKTKRINTREVQMMCAKHKVEKEEEYFMAVNNRKENKEVIKEVKKALKVEKKTKNIAESMLKNIRSDAQKEHLTLKKN